MLAANGHEPVRVGILDILALPARRPADRAYHLLITKQFASITPQAISVWRRRRGHRTFYATYYGTGDPRRLLPHDLDIVFIASYTQASAMAYVLGVLHRQAGARTVIGGPHAKAFPADCLRFFDLVVGECDELLVADILAGRFDPGSVISSARPFQDVPTVEERMPEIRASSFFRGTRRSLSTVPMLTSLGCPYRCDFCIDWDNPYRELGADRLAVDLRYVARHLRGSLVMFHDPNFAVSFDRVFEALEALPPGARPPYLMESSPHRPARRPAASPPRHELRPRGAGRRVLDALLGQGRGRPAGRHGEGGARRRALPPARRARALSPGQLHLRPRHR